METLALIKKANVTSALPEDAQKELASVARSEQFKVYTQLAASGESHKYLRLVIKGHIDLCIRSIDGREITMVSIGPGAWATWLATIDSNPPIHDFYAAAHSQFLAFPVEKVVSITDRYPIVYRSIITEVGNSFRHLLDWAEQSTILDNEKRLARLIEITAAMQGRPTEMFEIKIPQEKLAQLMRCSRQTVNQILGSLATKGLLKTSYGRIIVPDGHKLRAWSRI
ncbi:MAG: CRP/FNR family cyclic AMP-dependent transcriptional regulator [Candidatus Azotimanducaceae bacterium]|jgi:CRP/FNR family cyclic AMP-dependent transcriptional regulator